MAAVAAGVAGKLDSWPHNFKVGDAKREAIKYVPVKYFSPLLAGKKLEEAESRRKFLLAAHQTKREAALKQLIPDRGSPESIQAAVDAANGLRAFADEKFAKESEGIESEISELTAAVSEASAVRATPLRGHFNCSALTPTHDCAHFRSTRARSTSRATSRRTLRARRPSGRRRASRRWLRSLPRSRPPSSGSTCSRAWG